MFQSLGRPEIVARGLALGLVPEGRLSPALAEKLRPLVGPFRRWAPPRPRGDEPVRDEVLSPRNPAPAGP